MKVQLRTLGIDRHPRDTDAALIRGSDAQGREYIHEAEFTMEGAARQYLAISEAAYVINDEYWTCRIPYGSDAWDADGMEATLYDDVERQRYGL